MADPQAPMELLPPGGPDPKNSELESAKQVLDTTATHSVANDFISRLIGLPLAIGIFLGTWWLLYQGSEELRDGTRSLPSPGGSITAIGELAADGFGGTSLYSHAGATTARVVATLLVAIIGGGVLGSVAGINRWTRGLLDPLFNGLRFTSPVIAILFSVIATGLNGNKILPLAIPSTFVVADGVSRALSRRSAGLPGVPLPEVITAIRTALLVVWIAVSVDELLGGSNGLFVMALRARNFLQVDVIGAVALLLLLLGVAMDSLVRLVGYLFGRTS